MKNNNKNKNINFFKTDQSFLFGLIKYHVFDMLPRLKAIKNFVNENFTSKNKEITVLDGPFKGMKYPKAKSYGSVFIPKLLGVYEFELDHLIKEIIETKYDVLIDVGCAEGYYAVGLAKYGNIKQVYAYDISHTARELCKEMATKNSVGDKIQIKEEFNEKEFNEIIEKHKNDKILFILDVEGAEYEMFDFIFKKKIKNLDLLIELHDLFNVDITDKLNKLSKDYNVERIFGISDFQRTIELNPKELKNTDFKTKYYLLLEGRPEQMKWYFIKS